MKTSTTLLNMSNRICKAILTTGLAAIWILALSTHAPAQCTNSAAFGTVTAPTGTTPVTISTCVFQSEYSTINSVIAGNRYVLTGSIAGTFITVRFGTPGGAVVAAGVTPLQWTAPCNGTYYAHWNTNPTCGTAFTCMTATIACASCGAASNQCNNATAFGTITAPTTGTVTISTCSFQAEYSTLNGVQASTVYRLTGSAANTFITVRQGTSGGTVIASGTTPLIFTSTVAGTYFAHWNTSPTCGTAFSCITTQMGFVGGNPCPTGCTNTSPYGTVTIPTNNCPVTIFCVFAGEYSTLNGAVAGTTLRISSSIATDFLTVRSGTFNGPIVASGTTPLQFSNTFTGTLFVHVNTNSACGTQFACRDITVKCVSCVSAPCNCILAAAACGNNNTVTIDPGNGIFSGTMGSPFGTPGRETIYTYTPPTTGIYTITQVSMTTSGYIDYFFKPVSGGCSNTGWTFIQDLFGSGPTSVGFSMTAGVQYYILIDPEFTGGTTLTWRINCATPPYDPCANILASNVCGVNNTTTIPSGNGAWNFYGGPFSVPGAEVIYTFTPTITGSYTITQVTSTTGSWVDYFYKPVSGGCNNTGWTFIDDLLGNGVTSTPPVTLTGGVAYYIMLDPENTAGGTVTWRVNCALPPPPPNDQCTAVTPVTIAPGGSATFTGTTEGATTTNDGAFTAYPTVWHAFTLTGCADVTLSYCGNNPPFGNIWLNLATACPPFSFTPAGTYNNTSCTSGPANYVVTWVNLQAGTYYVPIMGLSTVPGFQNTPGPYSVTLTTVACPPPPPNDNCVDAIPVSCGSVVTGSTTQATNETGLPCGSANKGVWYSLTLPTSGIISINTCTGTNYDSWLSIYSGTCGALTCIGTNDDFCGLQSQVTTPPLPAGTYLILVSGYGTTSGNFTLTINCTLCPAPPVGGTASGPSSGCTGSQLTYTVTGASSVQWQVSTTSPTGPFTNITGATSPTLVYTPTTAGSYYFRNAASAPGCVDDFSNVVYTTVISSGGSLSTSVTPANACPGQTVTLTASFTVPASVTVTISGPAWLDETTWTITGGFSGGPYGFGSTNTVTITPPSPFIFFIETQGTFNDNQANYTIVCNATSTTLLSGTINGGQTFTSAPLSCGGAPLTMTNTLWTGPSVYSTSNPALFVANAGSGGVYNFTAEAPNGCPLTGTVTLTMLPAPSPAPTNNSPVCEGQTILLFGNPSGVSRQWSGPNGFSSTAINPTVTSNAQQIHEGTYTYTVTNSFGCSASATTEVIVHELPVPYLISSTNPSCLGYSDGEIIVGSTGAAPFLFAELNNLLFDYGNTGTFSGLYQGLYTIHVTDDNGCESSPTLDVLLFDYDPIPPQITCPANMSFSNSAGQCGRIVFYPTPVGTDNCPGAVTIQLQGLASGSFYPIGTTLHTYQVTDAFGQTASCSFTVTVNDTEAPTITGCPTSFAACNPISWTPPAITDNCSVNVTASHAPGVFPNGTTTVTYTATDPSGNTSTCSFNVTVLLPSLAPTGITSNRAFNNICLGENITLTVQGGSLGDGAVWKWYSGSCGGTLVNTGSSSITVAPASTTTYYVRAEGTCNVTACASITVIVSTAPPGHLTIVSAPDVLSTGVVAPIVVSLPPGAVSVNITTNQPNSGNMLFGNSAAGPWSPAPWSTNQTTFYINVVGHQQNYNIFIRAANACGQSGPRHHRARGSVAAPVSITGPTVACGGSSYTYTSAPIANTVGYFWSLNPPSAGTISGGNSQTVTVTFASGFTTAQLCVHGRTTFGLDGPSTCITISNVTATPGPISGDASPCQGSTQTYSIAPVTGATSYNWTVLGSPVIGQNGTSITVTMPGSAFSGQVCVTAVSPCGPSSAPSCLNIASGVTPPIGSISGPTIGLCGALNVNYSLSTSGALSYLWSAPGLTIVSGQGTNSINVNFPVAPASSYTIAVTASYPCGTESASITVSPVPATPTVLPTTLCANTAELYIASAAGASYFSWAITGGTSFYNPGPVYNENAIQWGLSGNSFTVTAHNACGSSAPYTLNQNCRLVSGEMTTGMVEVYPNPTRGLITVKFGSDRSDGFVFELMDLSGRLLNAEKVNALEGVNEHVVDLSSYVKGMYLLNVRNSEGLVKVVRVAVE